MQPHLTNLRKELHQIPETSGNETKTAERIAEELRDCKPDILLQHLGGNGIAALFQSKSDQVTKTILFRAELDAIPVAEKTGLEYQSKNKGVMHGCGHDGHMTILIGLAQYLKKKRPDAVDVWLLFQPAEETGTGAAALLADTEFQKLNIDHAYALHNLPGYEEKKVYIKEGPFASASSGVEVYLKGRFSHAAYPEQGLNPSKALAGLLMDIEKEMQPFTGSDPSHKFAVTYISMGERAFGISPGEATLGITVRTATDEALQKGIAKIGEIINKRAAQFEGDITWARQEPFAATVNEGKGVEIVEKAANKAGIKAERLEEPFAWSEDFGEFRKKFPITLFGLGAGSDVPHLHSETYDFNDELLSPGIEIFSAIVDYYSSG